MPVKGGGAGGPCCESRFKYRNPATPAASTNTMTMAAGGIENRFCCGPAAWRGPAGLFAANGNFSDLERGRGHGAAKLQVVANLFHAQQHILQITGNGDLGNRERQFAVAYPQTRGAARVIAGDNVDAHADQFRDIESVGYPRDNPLRRLDAVFHEKVPVAYPTVSGQAAPRRS